MSKTIYSVEGSPPGAPSSGRTPSGAGGEPRRRTLFWVFLALLVITLVMIAVIAVLGATESGAAAEYKLAISSEDPVTTTTSPASIPASSIEAGSPPTSLQAASSTTSSSISTTTSLLTHTIADPVRIVIPSLKVDAKVVQVGLDKNGAMQIPAVGIVGWYGLGPAPGASGPCVVVSHVSYGGKKGAFYYLKNLKAGDEVLIYDQSGDVATFQVDSTETILKSDLPKDKIWNNTKESVIRLVTCGGAYNPTTKHYLSNVIVYGHLVK